jgi:hypothetical protein
MAKLLGGVGTQQPYQNLPGSDEWQRERGTQRVKLSEHVPSWWLPRIEHPRPEEIKAHQNGEGARDLAVLAHAVRELFPTFTFSSALMEAYSAVLGGEGAVDLQRLCDRLVYINNNLRVYDIRFERSWFSGSLGIDFRSQTGRDAVVVIGDTSKAQGLLEKMARTQQAAEHLKAGDVLIGLNQARLTDTFSLAAHLLKQF